MDEREARVANPKRPRVDPKRLRAERQEAVARAEVELV